MGRDTHATLKGLELLPYYLTSALESNQKRLDRNRKKALPPWVVAVFSAFITLGVYQQAEAEKIAAVGGLFLGTALITHFVGRWVIRVYLAFRESSRPLGSLSDHEFEDRAERFLRVGTNALLLSDGMISCSEQGGSDVEVQAFFLSEATQCLHAAASTIDGLTENEATASRAVRWRGTPPKKAPSANAVDEYRLRWALDFAKSIVRRLLIQLDRIDIAHEDQIRRDIAFIDESLLNPALAMLSRLALPKS